MTPERESNSLNYRRVQWLKLAVCPFCTESNAPPRSNLIELQDDGRAHCNACDKTWSPDV